MTDKINTNVGTTDNLIKDLRDDLETGEVPANDVPEVRRKSHLLTKFQDAKHLKPFLIRGIMIFLAILLIGQIFYVTVTLPKLNGGGPITISTAVDQLGEDLAPTLAPPPSQR